MKILSIIAQKPSSTGSGVYLTECVKSFSKMGHTQEIVCASYFDDDLATIKSINNVKVNPLIFDTDRLPFHIAGMSDVMPYKSIKYSDFITNKQNLDLWMNAFKNKISEVVESFKPDLIICHHLYLLTAITRDICKNVKIYGICHNTDIRQLVQTDLCRSYIKENICNLDKLFFPSEDHMNKAINLYGIDKNKCKIIGIGYNNEIFYNKNTSYRLKKNKILYVGKVAKKKGVLSLVKAFNLINDKNLTLDILGGSGDENEYIEIKNEAQKLNLNIKFLSPTNQKMLCDIYNNHEVFVLPSFSEGIPMVPIEAMACGCKVVISDLDGVRNFYESNIKNAFIKYVELPKLLNYDNPKENELITFDQNLANAITNAINDKTSYSPDLSNISWENMAKSMTQ